MQTQPSLLFTLATNNLVGLKQTSDQESKDLYNNIRDENMVKKFNINSDKLVKR